MQRIEMYTLPSAVEYALNSWLATIRTWPGTPVLPATASSFARVPDRNSSTRACRTNPNGWDRSRARSCSSPIATVDGWYGPGLSSERRVAFSPLELDNPMSGNLAFHGSAPQLQPTAHITLKQTSAAHRISIPPPRPG